MSHDYSHRRPQPHADDRDLPAELRALRDGYGDVEHADTYDTADGYGDVDDDDAYDATDD